MNRRDDANRQTRRQFIKQSAVLATTMPFVGIRQTGLSPTAPGNGQGPLPVSLRWLGDHVPGHTRGITWGVPWPKGQLTNADTLALVNPGGDQLDAQHWVTARWPDGSVKWTAHAATWDSRFEPSAPELHTTRNKVRPVSGPLTVHDDGAAIQVDTGVMQCTFPKSGQALIRAIRVDGQLQATDGRLVLEWQSQPEPEVGKDFRTDILYSEIQDVRVEHQGPVRAVIRIAGTHRSAATGRTLLPFIVRCYCYRQVTSIRMVHTIVYDADEYRDFFRGVGVQFSVPMRDTCYDRHIRFCGANGGVFGEAVQGLTGLRRDPGKAVREAQVAGRSTPDRSTFNESVVRGLPYIPAFGDYSLAQHTPDGFVIRKRTTAGHGWLTSAYGERAAGVGYLGGATGGLAFGIRNFWQSFPARIDIRHAHTDNARLTLWLWAPDGPDADLRFYHDGMGQDTYESQLKGLDITYEDYEPGFGTPHGVARTSELELWPTTQTPSRETLVQLAREIQDPPLLVCSPTHYQQTGVFGRAFTAGPGGNPTEDTLEAQLSFYIDHYKKQIEQHRWYGFWNYGDVMHTYDDDRHVWRYDVGGFAWDNSELSTDLWLWYYFLRSGRHDVFRMAEAMSRHTGEVDVHHLGRFAPLGSRHNVYHWGCSAKQLRISTVINRRFLYYLTADERVGELMREQLEAARTLKTIVPGRKIGQRAAEADHLVSMGFGTDWGALASAWFTEWERTGDERMKQRLVNSMRSIGTQPRGFFTGVAEMDLETGTFQRVNHDRIEVSHLSAAFGLAEICAELIDAFDVPEFRTAWLHYCQAYNADQAWQQARFGISFRTPNLGQGHSRLTAYAGWLLNDQALKQRAWKEFYAADAGMKVGIPSVTVITPPNVLTERDYAPLSTNAVAQWCLAAMQCLAYAGEPTTTSN